MDARFEAVDRRFDTMDRRVDALSETVDGRISALDDKVPRQFVWLVGILVTTLVATVGAMLARA